MHDFVGDPAVLAEGQSRRMSGGELLKLIDLCAAQASNKHCLGVGIAALNPSGGAPVSAVPPQERHSVTTVAMTDIVMLSPIMHGDYVKVKARVVDAGKSSVTVHVGVEKMQFPTTVRDRRIKRVSEAVVFYVAIDGNLRPAAIVPPVRIESERELILHQRALAMRADTRISAQEQAAIKSSTATPDREAIQTAINIAKPDKVAIGETELIGNRFFFRAYLNFNDTIFGGEILNWMEQHACQCGRHFAVNRRVVTVGMHSVEFKNPIFHSDWATIRAKVVYVRNSTFEVDVEVSVERGGKSFVTNHASFILSSLDDNWQPRPVPIGLDLQSSTDNEVRAYLGAKTRYDRLRKIKEAE
jgi:acyl-CoA hydrolase